MSNKYHAPLVAGVLAKRDNRALVFRGVNGLDELSTVSGNEVWEVRNGQIDYYEMDATADLGLPAATIGDLRGQDATYNAAIARRVIDGEKGPVRDSVNLNAAGAIVAEGVRPIDGTFVERMRHGLAIAEETVDSGRAADLLTRWIELSNRESR